MASRTNLADSALQARLRDKLNLENVKLWLLPFFNEPEQVSNDNEILALASRYSTEFEMPEDEVAECLYSLQRNALERLAERNLFKETGMSTIRLKLSGFSVPPKTDLSRLQTNLTAMTGRELKSEICKSVGCNENQIKLICQGRVINENQVLELQNVKNGSQVMVLYIPITQESFQSSEDSLRQLEETKDSANYLAGVDHSGYSLQITDQSGKALELPEEERKSIAVALALHEKGRCALKSMDYSRALIFLLEADSMYNQCQSSLLERVDNYGILNVDIAWCYLSLKSISELPAVEARLRKSEQALHRSYGENMERVVALKGSTGWEAALFVRLHILQGIAAYHLGHIERAKFLIGKVDDEIKRLQVSDDQLAELINMGYGSDEARMSLRSTWGNVAAAVDLIIRKREEKSENKRQEKEASKRKKLQKKLGVCNNGDPVNISLWNNLKEMGFNGMVAAAALRKSNNDLNEALHDVSDINFMTEVVTTASQSNHQSSHDPQPSTSANVAAIAAAAAASVSGLTQGVTVPNAVQDQIFAALVELESTLLDVGSEEHLSTEDAVRSQKAYDVLSENTAGEADYIDLTLSAENAYINQYKELLRM